MTLYRRYLVTISSLEVDSISKVTATFPDAAAPLRAWLYVSIHTTGASRAASATVHPCAAGTRHCRAACTLGQSSIYNAVERLERSAEWRRSRRSRCVGVRQSHNAEWARSWGPSCSSPLPSRACALTHARSATARHTPDPDAARAPLAAVSGLRDCDGSRPGDWPASPSIRSPAAPLHALTSHLRRYGVRVNASINREARTHPSVPRPNIFERGHMPAGPSENSHSIDLIR
jgi:hypothetical protein